ncbi:MAG TPA: aurora kinase A-interacting protein [Syntrophorhabdaceae bacterium]|nr:aurora kinase A-interacting protein [Syntrophorhabdaceae bacterium]
MGSVMKWRKKKIRKHKYRKLRKRTRHQRRK